MSADSCVAKAAGTECWLLKPPKSWSPSLSEEESMAAGHVPQCQQLRAQRSSLCSHVHQIRSLTGRTLQKGGARQSPLAKNHRCRRLPPAPCHVAPHTLSANLVAVLQKPRLFKRKGRLHVHIMRVPLRAITASNFTLRCAPAGALRPRDWDCSFIRERSVPQRGKPPKN